MTGKSTGWLHKGHSLILCDYVVVGGNVEQGPAMEVIELTGRNRYGVWSRSKGQAIGGGWDDPVWEIDADEVKKIVAEMNAERAAEVKQIVDAAEKEKAIFARAAESGTRQQLRSYMSACDDPKEQCDHDQITIWAMPDGSRSKSRQHCW